MLAKVYSAAVVGLDAEIVEVEIDIGAGLPQLLIVGLPDKAIDEAKERVRSAIRNSDVKPPSRRTTVNLAPADLPKVGPAYDLPIAAGILAASKQVNLPKEKVIFLGELALDGHLRHISGVLPIMLKAKAEGFRQIYLPKQNAAEASLVSGLEIYPTASLKDLIWHLKGEKLIKPLKDRQYLAKDLDRDYEYDFAHIKGQEQAKRALEIAAAGGHNILLTGPPGSGKTLLAKALPSILPAMTREEALDVTKIYSVAGLLSHSEGLIPERPFRNPHHTSSNIAIIGGGQHPRPGETTLAHLGVLFLDELPEFGRSVLEVLRQPLEDRRVTISRAAGTLSFPADFTLVAAMNPCPCGYLSDPTRNCICSPTQIIRYQKRISGPLLDRIDLYIEVPRVKYEKLTDEKPSELSAEVRKRVQAARNRQLKRLSADALRTNHEMKIQHLRKYCQLDEESKTLLKNAVNQLQLSARAYHRIIKLARTIADLEGAKDILSDHIGEALQYRPKEQINF